MYYDGKKIREKNCLFNFIITLRGGGKTIDMKKYMVETALNGNKFIYIRRMAVECEDNKLSEFWSKMQALGYYDEYKLSYKSGKFFLDDKIIGYCIPLSTSSNIRSQDFVGVTDIFFEEFVLFEDNIHRYLPDEVFKFLELYNTIAREEDVRVFFIGNKIQEYNPYFLYFNLKPPKRGIKVWNDMAIEIWEDTELIQQKKKSRFGKIISGTEYESYAVDNNSYETNTTMISKIPKGSYPFIDFQYNKKLYGVWVKNGNFYMSETSTNKQLIVGVENIDLNPNTINIKAFKQLQSFRTYKQACLNNSLFCTNLKVEQVSRLINRKLLV